MNKVIIVDDDRAVRLLIEKGLGSLGFEVTVASTAMEGLRMIESQHPNVALIDITLPELHGFELFRKIRAVDDKIPIIFVTADISSETTIQAMRIGAYDYLSKPINVEQLSRLVTSACEARRQMDEPVTIPLSNDSASQERFVGRSLAMQNVYKAIGRVAAQDVAVLIRGESGCGKELVARAILQHSERSMKPFTVINCAAIPDQLLESELFGYEKGAFTGAEQRRKGKFEQCDGGTIFLDEIGDMSLLVQGKVLRLIQYQRFQRLGGNDEIGTDVRIIAATNRNLEEMVGKGDFREDLFYRLNGYTIELPSLRERKEDIPLLLEYFLNRERRHMGKLSLQGITPSVLVLLVDYAWPGNIRQLQSVIRHSILHSTGTVLGPESLPLFITENTIDQSPQTASDLQQAPNSSVSAASDNSSFSSDEANLEGLSDTPRFIDIAAFIESRLAAGTSSLYGETLDEVERYLFMRVLQITGGNQSKTADILGVTRGKVRDRIAHFGIQLDRAVTVQTEA